MFGWRDKIREMGEGKSARTSRCHRECRASCQKRVYSPTLPTNATPYHLYHHDTSTVIISTLGIFFKKDSLTLKKMIQTSIPRNLKFGSNAYSSSTSLGNNNTFNNAFHISLWWYPRARTHTRIHFQFQTNAGKSTLARGCVPGNPSPIGSGSYIKIKLNQINRYERRDIPCC